MNEDELLRNVDTVLETFLSDEGWYEPLPSEKVIADSVQAIYEYRRLAKLLGDEAPTAKEALKKLRADTNITRQTNPKRGKLGENGRRGRIHGTLHRPIVPTNTGR